MISEKLLHLRPRWAAAASAHCFTPAGNSCTQVHRKHAQEWLWELEDKHWVFLCLALMFAQFKKSVSPGEMAPQLCQLSITCKRPITRSLSLKDKVLTWPLWLNQKSRLCRSMCSYLSCQQLRGMLYYTWPLFRSQTSPLCWVWISSPIFFFFFFSTLYSPHRVLGYSWSFREPAEIVLN